MNQELVDEKWSYVRSERNSLLSHCDWTQMPDCSLSEGDKNVWKTYRQTLRDITLQSDPFNIEWPAKPDD
jgi:hypothetical protein